jgi:DNA-binding transcriptional ArsR family regulator
VPLAEHRAELLRTLGNPVRLRILALLCADGECAVGDIAREISIPQSSASRQLASLRLLGLVQVRGDGAFRHYSIAVPELRELLTCLTRCRGHFPDS